MKVSELIKLLQELPGDPEVMVPSIADWCHIGPPSVEIKDGGAFLSHDPRQDDDEE